MKLNFGNKAPMLLPQDKLSKLCNEIEAYTIINHPFDIPQYDKMRLDEFINHYIYISGKTEFTYEEIKGWLSTIPLFNCCNGIATYALKYGNVFIHKKRSNNNHIYRRIEHG